jgi:TetR/AcrR family transcriptional repressor of nem operon
MDSPPGRKQLTHERVVETAARALRRSGFAGVGVAEVTEQGCPVASLASEMPRQSREVGAVAARRVRGLVATVQHALPTEASADSAPAIAGQLVGAMQLARALGDNAQGKALLAATRRALLAQYDSPSTH